MTEHHGSIFSSIEATLVFPEQEAPLKNKKVFQFFVYKGVTLLPDSYGQ